MRELFDQENKTSLFKRFPNFFLVLSLCFVPIEVLSEESSNGAVIASMSGSPVLLSQTADYVRLNFTMFTVEFYKGSAGYNKIFDGQGNVLVYNEQLVLEYFSGSQWKQRGVATDILVEKLSDYHFKVRRFYTDYVGTTYNVTYDVKANRELKVTVALYSA